MNNLYQIPLLRPTLGFIVGIILPQLFQWPIAPLHLFILLLILTIAYQCITFLSKVKYFKSINIIFWLLAISLGASIAEKHQKKDQVEAKEKLYSMVTIEEVQKKEKSYRIIAKMMGQGSRLEDLKKVNGRVLIYLEPNNFNQVPQFGDSILFHSAFRQISKPKNPNGFDFKKFMHKKGIYHQTYLKKETYEILPNHNKNDWRKWIISRQKNLLEIFEKYLVEKENIAIAKAMILGNKENMTEALSYRFAVTGSMHILAVSGMHVGIVSLMILGFLNLFRTKKSQLKILKGIISIFLVWVYAIFTGAGPAVIRASIMFTLFFIAKFLLKREVSIYNILCASAFIMLLNDPYQLFQLGFQLSFLAVISIVYFYPYLKKLLLTPYPLINTLISCLNISIAAQILVFPISTYYFNMFSPAFLLTSLFVSFAATAILGLGLLLLSAETLGLTDLCENLIGPLLEGSLEFLNQSLILTESIQFLKVIEYNLDITQLIILYLVILYFMIAIGLKSKAYLIYSLSFVILFSIYSNYKKKNIYSQSVAYIYHQKDQPYLEFYDQENCYSLGSIPEENQYFKKELKKTKLIQHTEKRISLEGANQTNTIEYNEPFLRIGHRLFAFAQAEKLKNYTIKNSLDFLLVNSESDELEKIEPKLLTGTTIVLDASLSYSREKQLKRWINKEGLNSYNIKEKGALIIEI